MSSIAKVIELVAEADEGWEEAAHNVRRARPRVRQGRTLKPIETVLLIDDDPDTRDILRTYLGHHGYAVAEARTLADGLRMAAAVRPSVIVCELIVPWPNGPCMLDALEAASLRAPVTIVLTAELHWDVRAHAARLGVPLLAKPINPADVLAEIRRRAVRPSPEDLAPARQPVARGA